MEVPMISICIPAYNCDNYIVNTLDCLCAQTYRNIEIIIVDDGSSDGTFEIAEKYPDPRIKLFSFENGGAAVARNRAYMAASGTYILFFDADDYIGPTFLSEQFQRIADKNGAIVISAWGRFYNDDLQTFLLTEVKDEIITFKDWIKTYWYRADPMTNPGRILIPRHLIEEAGLWNETLTLNDDLEFYTRIFLRAKEIIINKNAIFYYRSGVSGLSSQKSAEAHQSLFHSISLSIRACLAHYKSDPSLYQSYANMLQSFIYLSYPHHRSLIALAEKDMKELVPADLEFQASGYTKIFVHLLGWKNTKIIKNSITKLIAPGKL